MGPARPDPRRSWAGPFGGAGYQYLHVPAHHPEDRVESDDDLAFYRVRPRVEPGDLLWVREAWGRVDPEQCSVEYREIPRKDDCPACVCYRADGDFEWTTESGNEYNSKGQLRSYWKPSIHMPRWASRLTLEVVRVRAERLQAISGGDGKAEGFESCADFIDQSTWCRQHWDANPWVWVVEFKPAEVIPCR